MERESRKLSIILEIAVVYLLLLAIVSFSSSIVGLGGTRIAKMVLTVAVYIALTAVPIIVLKLRKIPFTMLGFVNRNIKRQLLIALIIAIITISAAVIIPLLLGINKTDVLSFKSSSLRVLVFYILFDLICVGFGEEIAFRGYLYGRTGSLSSIPWLPMLLSALLFGFLHYPNTHSLINVASTSLLGLLYGFCKWRVKDCTLLSLSLAHGLNDAVIITLSYFIL